ncbi:MAG TPA: hypothetical protein VET90_03045, partial [Candidatus Binatus sp.]|nr:hypothetical protein [Candidatus Binatus sp.]
AATATIRAELPTGRLGRAAEVTERWRPVAEALADDPSAVAAVAGYWGVVANVDFRRGSMEDAVAGADRAIRLGEPLALDAVVAQALVTKGSALAGLRRTRESAALLRGALADAEDHGIHEAAIRAGVNLAGTTTDADPRGSIELTRQGIELTRRLGIRNFDAYFAGNATAAVRTGEWAWLRSTVEELLAVDPERPEAEWIRSLLNETEVWTEAGRDDDARRLLARGRADGDFQTVGNCQAFLVKFAYARGRDDDALEWARRLVERPVGWFYEIGLAGRIAARIGRSEETQAIVAVLAGVPNGAIRTDAQMVRAVLAARDSREAEALAGFRAGIESYRDLGLQFDVALAGLAMAEVLPASIPAVAEAVEEARGIAAALGATRVTWLLDEAAARPSAPPAARAGRVEAPSSSADVPAA